MAKVRWRGLDWDPEVSMAQRHLHLWKRWREYKGAADLLNPVEEHLYEACKLLFTKDQLTIHPWFETMAHSWTHDAFSIFWGCAGSGKSHALGLFVLLDFITDPDCTFTLLASTSKDMLAVRSFASVVDNLTFLKKNRQFHVPFKFAATKFMIVPEASTDEDLGNLKHVIKGVAVQDGSAIEARQNLQGVHTRYVRAVFDELAGMRPAAMDSRMNLSQCFDFKLMGACNPESIYDEAGKYSEPKAGWASVSEKTRQWETPWGMCYRFDGLESPGIKEPEKYPFLPGQKYIDDIVKANRGNWDAPAIWTMLRAFPPPQMADRTILTEAQVRAYNMLEPVPFKTGYTKVAVLDPAFTSGGDDCVLVTAKIGFSVQGILTIVFDHVHYLAIKASDPTPVTTQIVNQAVKILQDEGVTAEHFGCDDSGTQSVADAMAERIGRDLVRFNYSMKPPDLPVSVSNATLASKKYKNVITWLYFTVMEYAERGQIRGLPRSAAEQMCKRKLGTKQQPHMLQSKAEHKKLLKGKSPDEGDACAMIAGIARMTLGIAPGATEWAPGGVTPASAMPATPESIARYNNMETDYSSENSEIGVDLGYMSQV